jgi:hypothetical protein
VPAPRRQRRQKDQEEPPPWDAPQWPLLAEQQRLQAALDPAEVAAAQQRCQAFLAHGLEAVGAWWFSEPSPAEQQAMRQRQAALAADRQALADAFG